MPPYPAASEPKAGRVRQVERVEIVQVDLLNYVNTIAAIAAVLLGEVVAEDLLIGGVEPAARRERKRCRITADASHSLDNESWGRCEEIGGRAYI